MGNIKKYVLTESWRQFRIYRTHGIMRPFASVLKSNWALAKKLKGLETQFYTDKK